MNYILRDIKNTSVFKEVIKKDNYPVEISGLVFVAKNALIANLNNGTQLQKMVRLDSKGLANLDIKEIVKAEGFFHLNGIKTPWGSSGTTFSKL